MRVYVLICFLLAGLGLPSKVISQKQGKRITVETEGFTGDTLMLAYFYGDRQYVADTTYRNKEGKFVFQTDTFWNSGIYLIVLPPDNKYTQIIISKEEGDLQVKINADAIYDRPEITRSKENKIFWDYLEFLDGKNKEAVAIKEALAEASPLGTEKDQYQEKLLEIDSEVKLFQRSMIEKHAGSLAAAIVKANVEVTIPDFEGEAREVELKRFQYFHDHYFDNMDLSDERLLRTPVFYDRVDRYLTKFTIQVPDSLIKALDVVLQRAEAGPENFKFLLIHYLNTYAKSKFVGMDALYVHLVDHYYAEGKAPWVEQEQLEKMIENANTLRPLLIGKVAPNITVFKEDLTPIALHDVDARFTILLFWAPDCGHCSKSMPDIVKFYDAYKDKGVEIFAVCTKLLEKEGTCWDAVKEKDMERWINTSDKYLRSKFGQVYNVKSTPQLYVLNKDKEIMTKHIGAEKLGELIDLLIRDEERLSESEQ